MNSKEFNKKSKSEKIILDAKELELTKERQGEIENKLKKILKFGKKIFKDKKSFKLQCILFMFNNLIILAYISWVFNSVEFSTLSAFSVFMIFALIWLINLKYNLPYRKEIF